MDPFSTGVEVLAGIACRSEGPFRVDGVEELSCVDAMGMIPFSSGFARETRR
jgi:hypothetical protein